uniref:Zinc finger BED domain-containing protein RICESLEEPER 2 n=1 Tax=Tanacetum cinerariifolium TaxID=118510 RepID=A0A6L2L7X3_TANCI|nr:zinc finger BED domain-containing protein RICESLEEPER 2 [Tanacetum cinerariifolium]
MATQSSSTTTGLMHQELLKFWKQNENPQIWCNFNLVKMSDGSLKAHCKHCGHFLKQESNSTLKGHMERYWERLKTTAEAFLAALAPDLLSVQASTVASEFAFSTSERVLSIRKTRLTPTSLGICICLKDHLDATERIQHIVSLEDGLEYEGKLHDVEVTTAGANTIFDEELALDDATSNARSSEPDDEDANLEQALI